MDATKSSLKVNRPVGFAAKFNTSRHALGLCRCVIVTCRYTIPNSGMAHNSIKAVVENALASVISRHPMLRVGIADEDTADPVYVDLEAIDLRQVIEWKEKTCHDNDEYTDYLLRSIEAQHGQLWEDLAHRPGWKIIIHQNLGAAPTDDVEMDVSFAFHHAIGDGQSALIFQRDFLRALNAGASTTDLADHMLHLSSSTVLPRPLEAVVPLTISWSYFLQVMVNLSWRKLAPSWLRSEPAPDTIPWTGEQVTLEPYTTNIRLLWIPDKPVKTLLAACRQHGTTLTPLFNALILASLSFRLPVASAPAFHAGTPISLRRFTDPDFDRENAMHCLVTEHKYPFNAPLVSEIRAALIQDDPRQPDVAESLLWRTAAELGKSLSSKVATLPHDDQIGLLAYISDFSKFWLEQIGTKRKDSWSVSNVGSLKAADSKGPQGAAGWQIKRSIFTQGALPMGAAFDVNVAGVEGEGIWVSLSWQETVVLAEVMDHVVEDLRTYVDGFGSDGKFKFTSWN